MKPIAAPPPSRDDVTDLGGFSPLKHADAAPNELLAFARSWDLWGGAAFVLFVVWMTISAVFSLQ